MRNAVEWCDDHIEVIDQTALPANLEVRELRTVADVVDAIARLVVRGAPAIGVCGGFGVVLGIDQQLELDDVSRTLEAARPTAVNLAWAVRRVADAARDGRDAALAEAIAIQDADREACRLIGSYGAAELANARHLMTHCNTGRLATSGIGTALGIVYTKALNGDPVAVIATETRPLLQGARLTAWELSDAGIPVTLIADSAAGAALRTRDVDAVVVGCDRVARNGDTANKVGTYNLAVLARASEIPFYVAGPLSSFDPDAPDGRAIEIELRSAEEIRADPGPDVDVWNPAFDVTPANLITAFVTDVGVLRPPYERSIPEALSRRR